jgi:hypothetical protein
LGGQLALQIEHTSSSTAPENRLQTAAIAAEMPNQILGRA